MVEVDLTRTLIVLTLVGIMPAAFSLGHNRAGVLALANMSALDRRSGFSFLVRSCGISSVSAGCGTVLAVWLFIPALHGVSVGLLVAAVVMTENARVMVADLPRAISRPDFAAAFSPALPRVGVLAVALVAWYLFDVRIGFIAALWLLTLMQAIIVVTAIVVTGRSIKGAESDDGTSKRSVHSIRRSLVSTGLRMTVANVSNECLKQADVIVVAAYFSPGLTVSYALASRLANLGSQAMALLNVAFMGWAAKVPDSEQSALYEERTIRRLITAMSGVAVVGNLIVFTYGDSVVRWLFGNTYVSSAEVLSLLLLGTTAQVCCGPSGIFLLRHGRDGLFMYANLISFLVFMPLEVFFGILHFLPGVAIASAVGTAVASLITTAGLRHTIGMRTWPTLRMRG